MNRALLVGKMCLMLAAEAAAQGHKSPRSHDQYIHYTLTESNPDEAMYKFSRFLADNGYPVSSGGGEYRSLIREQVSILVEGTSPSLKICLHSDARDITSGPAEFSLLEYGSSDGTGHRIWDAVIDMLRKYPHDKMYFSKQ